MAKKVFGTWVEEDLIKKIHIFCATQGLNINEFINNASELYFKEKNVKKSIKQSKR